MKQGFMNERVTGDSHESCFGGGGMEANWRKRHGDSVEDPFKALFFFWKGEWRVRQQLGDTGSGDDYFGRLIYSVSVSPHTAP